MNTMSITDFKELIKNKKYDEILDMTKNRFYIKYSENDKDTPLNYAIENENKELFDYLIDNGVDVNQHTLTFHLPFQYAKKRSTSYYLLRLIKAGIEIYRPETCFKENIFYQMRFYDVAEYLLTVENLNLNRTDTGFMPLHSIIENFDLPLVIKYIKKGANPLIKSDTHKVSTLVVALCYKKYDIIEYLLINYGEFLINYLDDYDESALYKAVHYSDLKAVEILLNYKPNPRLGKSCLEESLKRFSKENKYTNEKIIKLLLNAGCEINKEALEIIERPYYLDIKNIIYEHINKIKTQVEEVKRNLKIKNNLIRKVYNIFK